MTKNPDHVFLMEASGAAVAADRCHLKLQDWVQIKFTQLYRFGGDRPPIESSRENWLRYASMILGQNEYITASGKPDRCNVAKSFYGRSGYNMIAD